MAKLVFKDCYLAINSVDHSASTSSVELELEADEEEVTTFGSGGWKEHLQGLKGGTLNATFKADFANSALDDLLWAVFNTGTNVTFEVRPTQAAVGANNPKYTGSVVPGGHKVGGEVGSAAEVEVEFPLSGAVTRAEA